MTAHGSIIAFDANHWHGPWMNRQQLLSRLAHRGWTIVYSNGQPNLWRRRHDTFKSLPWWARHDVANGVILDIPGKALAAWPGLPAWERVCRRIHARQLTRLVEDYRESGADQTPLIVYIFHPCFFPYIEPLQPDYVVFHVRDAYPKEPQWSSREQHQLECLADRADLIIASGDAMAECVPDAHQHRITIVPNGADADAFISGEFSHQPDDLSTIPHPRVCYAGRLNAKIDIPLLYELAQARPQYHFVIIGMIANPAMPGGADRWREALENIQTLPNVHYLGPKHRTELPGYINHCDVNILIYALNEENAQWAKYCYPLKLHEYLAAGQPVVSSPLPAVQSFDHVVACVNGKHEWLTALDEAIEHGGVGTKHERQHTAKANSWDTRTELLEQTIQQLLHTRSPLAPQPPLHINPIR